VLQRYGGDVASAVPEGGLTDVHRYLVITLAGQDVTIDVTFPGDPAWDGHQSMSLACGDGRDFPAGEDPGADKAALEASHCDPQAASPSSLHSHSHQHQRTRRNARSAARE
jgi:hypothetical protein